MAARGKGDADGGRQGREGKCKASSKGERARADEGKGGLTSAVASAAAEAVRGGWYLATASVKLT